MRIIQCFLKATESLQEEGTAYTAECVFELEKITEAYEVELTFNPFKTEQYSPLTYSFKIRSLSDKPPIPDCLFGIDIAIIADGYKAELDAKKGRLSAKTKSSKATVKYRFEDIATGEFIPSSTEMTMTSDNKGGHTSDVIKLLDNKPTRVKLWVIAEDGRTTDALKGVHYYTFNPVTVFWSYADSNNPEHFNSKAYDEIKINKNLVQNGKIYVLVHVWGEGLGYRVDNSGLPQGQGQLIKLGSLDQYYDVYKAEVNVSELIKENDPISESDLHLKFTYNYNPVFTYKLRKR